jgi:hypothetical protein
VRSNRKIMRSAMVEVLESTTATPSERITACRLLMKILKRKRSSKPRTVSVASVFRD